MRAAFFDMDGTVLDSMQDWRECNLIYLERHGIAVTEEQRTQVVCASSGTHLFEYIRRELGHDPDIPEYRAIQFERMKAAYTRGIPPKPGAREYLEHLRLRGVKTILATATPSALANLALTRSGMMRDFDAVLCCDTLDASKRHAEYYHRACAIAGVAEGECMLFEDAAYSLLSGREAGLLGAVAVSDPTNVIFRRRLAELSDAMIDSFTELMP